MTIEKSAGVAQKPITLVDSAGRVTTSIQHHLPAYSVKNCTFDLKAWNLESDRMKRAKSGTNAVGTTVRPIVHSFKSSLAPSLHGKKTLNRTQLWAAMSDDEKEFMSNLNKLFNTKLVSAYAR